MLDLTLVLFEIRLKVCMALNEYLTAKHFPLECHCLVECDKGFTSN